MDRYVCSAESAAEASTEEGENSTRNVAGGEKVDRWGRTVAGGLVQ